MIREEYGAEELATLVIKYGRYPIEMALGAFEAYNTLVKKLGGDYHVECILNDEELGKEIVEFIVNRERARIYTCQVDKREYALQPAKWPDFFWGFFRTEAGIIPEHFPLQGIGIQVRKFKLLKIEERFPDHDPTTTELLDLVQAEGEIPDLADTYAFLRDNPDRTKRGAIVSLCGTFAMRESDGYKRMSVLTANSNMNHLGWHGINEPWPRYHSWRYLLVVVREPSPTINP